MFPMPTKKGVDENFVTIEANDLRRMVRATAFVSVRKDRFCICRTRSNEMSCNSLCKR